MASPQYLADAPPLNAPEDLKNHALLLMSERPDGIGSMQFLIDGKIREIQFPGKMTCNNRDALTVWLLQHCGIAQNSLWHVADAIADNQLVRLLEDYEPETAHYYAVSPFRTGESVKVDAFINFLREEFAKDPLC